VTTEEVQLRFKSQSNLRVGLKVAKQKIFKIFFPLIYSLKLAGLMWFHVSHPIKRMRHPVVV